MENQSTPAGGAPSGLAGGEHSGSLLIGQLSSGHQARGQISPGFSLVGDPALLALGTGQPISSMTTHDTGTGMQSLLLSMPQPAASQAFGQNLCARVDPKIKAKIWANEYVDFSMLLSGSPNTWQISLADDNKNDQAVIVNKQKLRLSLSLSGN